MRTAVFLLAVVVLAVVQSAQAQVPKPELCQCDSNDAPLCVSVNFSMKTFANRCLLDCALSQWKTGVAKRPYQVSVLHEGKCGSVPLPVDENLKF